MSDSATADAEIATALDTSLGAALAVAAGPRLLHTAWLPLAGRDSDAALVPWLETELARAGLQVRDVARWTVGTGPGSFSGLRVGLALVRGICRVTSRPLRGIPSSLALVTEACPTPRAGARAAVLHDARQGQVILSLFRGNGAAWRPEMEPEVVDPDELAGRLPDTVLPVTAQPDAVRPRLAPAAAARLVCLERVCAERLLAPSGWPWPETHEAGLASCTPIYVRPPVFVPPGAPPRVVA